MGLTFKENCPDTRNSGVFNLIKEFKKFNMNIDVCDPFVNKTYIETKDEFNLIEKPLNNKYEAIILAVAHEDFKKYSIDEIKKFGKKNHIVYDIKYLFNSKKVDLRI